MYPQCVGPHSIELFRKALDYIPGGVNSPVRAFTRVGGQPPVIARGQGAYVFDADGQRYIDYVGSWGPLILGHAHPEVVQAVTDTAQQGLSFGALCPLEIELAALICSSMPSIEKIRLVNSGTEATMTAIRLARGFTGRSKIIKFAGCYHGHSDSLLVGAGSGVLTLGTPSSQGVPAAVASETLVAPFNDLDAVANYFEAYADDIAGVIVEPIAGNMNLVPGDPTFLNGLRSLCHAAKSVLIFDEVMTGFRVALGGAQALYGIRPDLTTLGKVIGGGMPVAAVGGRAEIMNQLAPLGPVYQAGTLSGNPVCVAAGLATLRGVHAPYFFESLTEKTVYLVEGLMHAAAIHGMDLKAHSVGGMFGLVLKETQFNDFFHEMLREGIYLAPSPYEVGFISSAHTYADLEATLGAADRVFKRLASP